MIRLATRLSAFATLICAALVLLTVAAWTPVNTGGDDLGALLLAGYRPARVLAACANPDKLVLVLPRATVVAQVDAGARLEPSDRVQVLTSIADLDILQSSVDAFACTMERGWLGFVPQWKYRIVS